MTLKDLFDVTSDHIYIMDNIDPIMIIDPAYPEMIASDVLTKTIRKIDSHLGNLRVWLNREDKND